MITASDEAICIRHWDFSETSQTVSLFTRNGGAIRVIAKGSRREHGSHSGGVDLLARGNARFVTRDGGDLATLIEWELLETFQGIRSVLSASRTAYYCAELIGRFFQPHDRHERAYDALVTILSALGTQPDNTSNDEWHLLVFQWIILQEAGYQPRLSRTTTDAEFLYFDPREGGVVTTTNTPHSWKVRASTIECLNTLAIGQPQPEHNKPDVVMRGNRLLAAFIRDVLGEELFTMRNCFGEVHTRSS